METNELIEILRYCANNGCIEPCKYGAGNDNSDCVSALLTEAADRLEEQDRIIQLDLINDSITKTDVKILDEHLEAFKKMAE